MPRKTEQPVNNYKPLPKSYGRRVYVCFYCGERILDGSRNFIPINSYSSVPVCELCKNDPKHRG